MFHQSINLRTTANTLPAWVAHPLLANIASEVFNKEMPLPNQASYPHDTLSMDYLTEIRCTVVVKMFK